MILKKSKQNTLGVYLYKSVISLSLLLLHGFTFVIFIVSLSFPYYLPVKKDLENNYWLTNNFVICLTTIFFLSIKLRKFVNYQRVYQGPRAVQPYYMHVIPKQNIHPPAQLRKCILRYYLILLYR